MFGPRNDFSLICQRGCGGAACSGGSQWIRESARRNWCSCNRVSSVQPFLRVMQHARFFIGACESRQFVTSIKWRGKCEKVSRPRNARAAAAQNLTPPIHRSVSRRCLFVNNSLLYHVSLSVSLMMRTYVMTSLLIILESAIPNDFTHNVWA